MIEEGVGGSDCKYTPEKMRNFYNMLVLCMRFSGKLGFICKI